MGGGDWVSSARNRGWRGPIRVDGTRLPARTYAEFQTAARSEFFTKLPSSRAGANKEFLPLFRLAGWVASGRWQRHSVEYLRNKRGNRGEIKIKEERGEGGKGIKGAEVETEKARR